MKTKSNHLRWQWQFEFKLQDLWIGLFWKTYKSVPWRIDIWICVVPCFPLHIQRYIIPTADIRDAMEEQHTPKP